MTTGDERIPAHTSNEAAAQAEEAITDLVSRVNADCLRKTAQRWRCGDMEELFDRIRVARRGEN